MAEAVEYPKGDGLYVGSNDQVWRVQDGVVMPMMPVPFAGLAMTGPYRPLVVDESALDGATGKVSPPQEVIANVGEFASEWNLMTVAQRARWFDSIHSNANWAHRCFIENHDGRIQRLERRVNTKDMLGDISDEVVADRVLVNAGLTLDAHAEDDSRTGPRVRALILEALRAVRHG